MAAAPAERPYDIQSVEEGLTLVTTEGARLRLAEILIPEAGTRIEAEHFLIEMIDGEALDWRAVDDRTDRYGRLPGQGYLADGRWLNGAIVAGGLALVDAGPGNREDRVALLQLEAEARQAGRGHWRRGGAFRLAEAKSYRGPVHGYAVVQGRVLAVTRRSKLIYLNFGEDWRRDFTLGIEAAALDAFMAEGWEPEALLGREIRMRGWVGWYYGPFMKLHHPDQLERLSVLQ